MKITDNIEITNEDNMLLMARYPDNYFDLAIVDPPYGINVDKQRIGSERETSKWKNPKTYNYKSFDDSKTPDELYFKELIRVSKNQIIWGGNYFTEFLKPSKGWIVWDKKADIKEHLSMCELAWSSFDKKCNKYEYLWAGFKKKHQIERIHPTQKPVDLYSWLLQNYATPKCNHKHSESERYLCTDCNTENVKILDTHLGSGSIAIACHDYKFHLTACELDKEYYDASVKRITNHVGQTKLF